MSPRAFAQDSTTPPSPSPSATPAQASTPATASAQVMPRISGIETNRDMIAAEEPTDVVVNGSQGTPCALTVDFGDGSPASGATIAEGSPFPLKLAHTFPKMGDYRIRVAGAAGASSPACEGEVDAQVHVSPAGSKIEYITLSNTCPDGWKLYGAVAPDKSFSCTPIPDTTAQTNLIQCLDGMKYYVQSGRIGCRHPAPPPEETYAKAKTPKGKVVAAAKAKSPSAPLTKTPKAGAPGKKAKPAKTAAKRVA